jgi:hypothetical protein
MSFSKSSLSGENEGSLPKCVGSSPTSSTTLKQKLWRKLQSLDRKISKLPVIMLSRISNRLIWDIDKRSKLYIKLDEERKQVRAQLKKLYTRKD